MPGYIPEVQPKNEGSNQALYHAQMIVEAFAQALSDSKCMSQFPIAVYVQADQYQERLADTLDMVGRGDENPTPRNYEIVLPDEQSPTSTSPVPQSPNAPLVRTMKSAAGKKCLKCDFGDLPTLDLDRVFQDILDDINDFIENIKNVWSKNIPNFCHVSYFLSYLCIPDLVKMLAIILAALLKLMSTLSLGSFSLAAFVMGILGAILGAIFDYIMSLINYAIAPINCIIESIKSIMNSLPTNSSLQERLTPEQFELLGVEEDPDSFDRAAKKYIQDSKKNLSNSKKTLKNDFEKTLKTLEESYVVALEETFNDLIGVGDYLTCEDKRSGNDIGEKIGALFDLVQTANMITAVIERKSASQAFNELCKVVEEEAPKTQSQLDDPFSNEDIAATIAQAFGGIAEVVESEGEDVAILFTAEDNTPGNRIDINTCDLTEFIEEMHMDNILERSISIAEERLIGEGKDPMSTSQPRTRLEDIELQENQQILLFGQDEASLSSEIRQVIDEVVQFNAPDAETVSTSIDEEFKLKSNTLPEEVSTSTSDVEVLSVNEEQQAVAQDNIVSGLNNTVSGLPSGIVSKPLQLRCGTIDNLRDTLSSIKE